MNKVKTGPATLLSNREPINILCEIRNDFKKLHRPVFTKIIYYEPWVEKRFPEELTKHGPDYDLLLTREATKFATKYSALEIMVALTPLIVDENFGVDVRALIDGIVPQKKRLASSGIPFYLMEKYRTLSAVEEYLEQHYSFLVGVAGKKYLDDFKNQLETTTLSYGGRLAYTGFPHLTYSFNLQQTQSNQNTLDAAIREILIDYKEMRKKLSSPFEMDKDWAPKTDLGLKPRMGDIEMLLRMTPVIPVIGPELKSFISHHDRKLLSAVMLYLNDTYTLGVILNLHKKYWLCYTTFFSRHVSHGSRIKSLYKVKFKTELVYTLKNFCKAIE